MIPQGRFLSNIHDPSKQDARRFLHLVSTEMHDPASRQRAWERHITWVRENVIGPPQGTETYSAAELKEQGLVGLYANVEPDRRRAIQHTKEKRSVA